MEYTDREKKAINDINKELTDEDRREYMSKWFADDLDIIIKLLERLKDEVKKLDKDNNELKRIYKNTAEHLEKIGNTELSDYFYAQIGLVPTFYVGDIIDYYVEYYKQKEIIKELQLNIKDLKSKTQIISPLYVKENYVPKEVIREKIKELERYIYTGKNAPQDFLQYRVKAKIQGYKELLGE